MNADSVHLDGEKLLSEQKTYCFVRFCFRCLYHRTPIAMTSRRANRTEPAMAKILATEKPEVYLKKIEYYY